MTNESTCMKAEIRGFIIENFLFGDESRPFGDDLSLIDNDMVDSTGILELVSFIEERYGVRVADGDIVPANLDTIDNIAAFIGRKQTA